MRHAPPAGGAPNEFVEPGRFETNPVIQITPRQILSLRIERRYERGRQGRG
jgi:hypothetical protein